MTIIRNVRREGNPTLFNMGVKRTIKIVAPSPGSKCNRIDLNNECCSMASSGFVSFITNPPMNRKEMRV